MSSRPQAHAPRCALRERLQQRPEGQRFLSLPDALLGPCQPQGRPRPGPRRGEQGRGGGAWAGGAGGGGRGPGTPAGRGGKTAERERGAGRGGRTGGGDLPPTASLVTGLSIATGRARACVCACAGSGGVLSLLNPGGGGRRTLGAWNTGVRSRMEGLLPRCWGYRGGRGLRAPGGAGQGRGPGHTPWPGLGHRDTARRALAAGVLQLRSPAPGPQGRWCGPHVFAATQRCLASRVSTPGRLEPRSQAHLGPGRGAAGAGLTSRTASRSRAGLTPVEEKRARGPNSWRRRPGQSPRRDLGGPPARCWRRARPPHFLASTASSHSRVCAPCLVGREEDQEAARLPVAVLGQPTDSRLVTRGARTPCGSTDAREGPRPHHPGLPGRPEGRRPRRKLEHRTGVPWRPAGLFPFTYKPDMNKYIYFI